MSYDGHLSKRQRTDDGMLGMPGSVDKFDDPHKPPPSCVVHVRGLSESAVEADLVEAVQHFGGVRDVIMMPRKRQALIEFETISGSRNCVDYAQASAIYVAAQPAFFNFSTSQKIQRPGDPEDRPANHVLLFTILNPQYPITVDVMHTICSPYGQVLRIVIFKKNGVQAMVEFDSVESAKRGKQALNGADIYSGCCTLKIEYAKPTRLNVVRNDNESRDYTNPNLGMDQGGHRGQPLLADPRMGGGPTPYNGPDFNQGGRGGGGGGHGGHGGHGGGGYGGGGGSAYGGGPSSYYEPEYESGYGPGPSRGAPYNGPPDRYGGHRQDRYGPPPPQHYHDQGMMGPPNNQQQGAVLMVYGLNMAKINAERLFNLFCLYGNVVRVKFLKSKEGSAMVQMGDSLSAERAILNLQNTFFFDSKMQLSPSKQAFLQDVMNPHELPDGTPSYMDFMGNRNNRFTNPEAAKKNRVQGPAKVLHFFNTPPTITAEDIEKVFEKAGVTKPQQVKLFPSKTERSSSGLVEFENKAEAVEGLVVCNHTPVDNPAGKNPFIMKLCFSSAPIIG